MNEKQISLFRFISTFSLTATLVITLWAYFQLDDTFEMANITSMSIKFQLFVIGIVISSFASFLITWRLILTIVVLQADYKDNLNKKDLNIIIKEKKEYDKEKTIEWNTIINNDSQKLLNSLCHVLDIDIGRKYDLLNNMYNNTANYSLVLTKEEQNNSTFELGIGINGQAAESMKPLLLTNIPSDYVKIKSGSGQISPKNIYIIPIVENGTTKYLFELADMKANGKATYDKLLVFANEFSNTLNKG
ncbi:MAG: hypothetical protein B6I18_07445 [Bacteroidetes bacterium 4572_112]|nr:MAG: hypothetical protein B6I18_07445 [Bacteroidetes bacterium 4572_112]